MTKEEFISLLDRYIHHQCTAGERRYFDQFFQRFQQDDTFWKSWDLTERERIMMEMYTSLNHTLDAAAHEAKQRRRSLYTTLLRSAAAVMILAVSGWIAYALIRSQPAPAWLTETTPRGQRRTITFSDGSVIRLNAASSISFPKKFTGDTREVKLTGEAFFDVKRDTRHPFVVTTGGLQTKVLGTSFNVRAITGEADMEVTVRSGKVQVANDTHSVLIRPGEQARYSLANRYLEKRDVSLERYLAWTNNIIYLDNTPVREVVDMLERWYDIEIELGDEALGNCLLTGKYKSDNMRNVMNGLKFVQGIDCRFVDRRHVILTGTPCNPPKPMP